MTTIQEYLNAARDKTSETEKPKQFKVTMHPYSFKTNLPTPLIPNKEGIYFPRNKDEEEFLKYQVSRNLISYE